MSAQPVDISFRANGVANAKTTAVVEDSAGDIWIATSGGGVSCFTPTSSLWQTFTQVDGLADPDIRCMICTSNDELWFGTSGGASRYSPQQNQWSSYFIADGLPNNSVRSLLEDSGHRIWLGTNGGGLAIYTPERDRWQTVTTNNGLAGNAVNALLEDGDGRVWAGTQAGLSCYCTVSKKWSTFTETDGLINNKVNALVCDMQGNIWAGTSGGLSCYSPSTKKWKSYTQQNGLGTSFVQRLSFNAEGGLWAGTQLGISYYDEPNDQWVTYTKADGLSSNMVYGLFQDSQRNLWVATWGGGVSVLNDKRDDWTIHTIPSEFADTYALSVIKSGDHNVWIGTWGAISRYNTNSGEWLTLSSAEDLPNNNVQVLAADNSDQLWAGAYGGLMSYDVPGKQWQMFTQSDGLSNDNVTALLFLDSNELLVGTAGGLCQYGLSTKQWNNKRYSPLSNSHITALNLDTENNLWVGTTNGLSMLSAKGQWTSFTTKQGLLSAQVNAITDDANGDVWIGTKKGLNQYKSGASQLRDCTTINKLLGANIHALQADENTLWLACADGVLTNFNTLNKRVSALRRFGRDSLTSLALDAQNNLWLASKGGGAFWMFRDGPSAGYVQNFTAGSQQFASQFAVNGDHVSLGRPQAIAVSGPGKPLAQSRSYMVACNPVLACGGNHVWASSDEEGLTLINETSIKNQPATVRQTVSGLPSRHVLGLSAHANGDVWVATSAGAAQIDFESLNVTKIERLAAMPQGPVDVIQAGNEKECFLAFNQINTEIFSNAKTAESRSATSVWHYDKSVGTKLPVADESRDLFERSGVVSMAFSADTGLWIGTDAGLFFSSAGNSQIEGLSGVDPASTVLSLVAGTNGKSYALVILSSGARTVYQCSVDRSLANSVGVNVCQLENLPTGLSAIALDDADALWLSVGSTLFMLNN